ncbi:MAG: 30S ribosomal protein S8 [Candidatus Daviesbacteria bacterium]|nr:30S ribosomal protein S8 [Candidatus Daviesbacteria bacterium]
MMVSDSIGDALIRIKNGYRVGKESVSQPYSKLIIKIMKLLQKEGYIDSVEEKNHEVFVSLKYINRQPALTDLKRISKPSLRVYKGVNELPRVLSGLGIAIISTPKGIMTDKEARKKHLGGEVMALVW